MYIAPRKLPIFLEHSPSFLEGLFIFGSKKASFLLFSSVNSQSGTLWDWISRISTEYATLPKHPNFQVKKNDFFAFCSVN